MTLHFYNTLTRQKEKFIPIDAASIRMYVCGPTVYDFAHIGNARPVVVFDVLFRLLRTLYGDRHVIYVRNITDIDDKIVARAAENGETIYDLTARTELQFQTDMTALNALQPTNQPRATEFLNPMQHIIRRLLHKGHAYEKDGHVLFYTPSMPNYGALSGRNRDDQIAGARVDVAPYKKDPADFVLWKPSTPDQPGWDSPWGRGRPGWHIECSAMAGALLGETFDIHGGGLDLIFPHHENEIAQSCCANGTDKLANVWMHNGFVTVNGEKMSKSQGNFYTVHDLLQNWPGEVIRYALLSAHYRQPLDFTNELLKQCKAALDKVYLALRNFASVPAAAQSGVLEVSGLLDDLNTVAAITKLHELAGQVNKTQDVKVVQQLYELGGYLGLLQQDPEAWLKWQPTPNAFSDEQIEKMIGAREAARVVKDFAESDRIRDKLAAAGIILEDTATATTWRRG